MIRTVFCGRSVGLGLGRPKFKSLLCPVLTWQITQTLWAWISWESPSMLWGSNGLIKTQMLCKLWNATLLLYISRHAVSLSVHFVCSVFIYLFLGRSLMNSMHVGDTDMNKAKSIPSKSPRVWQHNNRWHRIRTRLWFPLPQNRGILQRRDDLELNIKE